MITKKYIKEHFSNLDPNTGLYHSDFDDVTIIKYLDGFSDNHEILNPIVAIYTNDGEVETGAEEFILSLGDLKIICEDFEGEIALNRDVEDRFVYSSYKHWICKDDKLVFY